MCRGTSLVSQGADPPPGIESGLMSQLSATLVVQFLCVSTLLNSAGKFGGRVGVLASRMLFTWAAIPVLLMLSTFCTS